MHEQPAPGPSIIPNLDRPVNGPPFSSMIALPVIGSANHWEMTSLRMPEEPHICVDIAPEPSRRRFFRSCAIGLSLADIVARCASGREESPPARAVILLWLWGGPSHLDTFDMKPEAPVEYRGPFEPIATAVPGVHVCELLPGLARRARQFALVRSLHHESNDHGVAGTIALTGSIAGAVGSLAE